MSRFLEALHSGRVLLMDGAMGTELQRAGIQPGECYEAWNLNHPDRVAAIHQGYMDAGAEVLLTNTFQANPVALGRHGLDKEVEAIYQAAAALARSVAGPERFVLASIGPLPPEIGRDEFRKRDWFTRVLRGCLEVDALLLETYSGWMVGYARDLLLELRAAHKQTKHLPVLLSYAFEAPKGNYYCIIDRHELESSTVDSSSRLSALGMNCGRDIGMTETIEIIKRYREYSDLPLFARPNAGTPTRDGNRWVYPHTPEQLAERLPELLEAGVTMVGGCCGTTLEHIAAFRPIVAAWNARKRSS